MPATGDENPARAAARVTRELRRLEALVARRRLRVRIRRALRGGLGAGATLAALIKLKLASSLALKLGLALVVGLGLAWPTLVLAALVLVGVVLSLLSLFEGGGSHLDCDVPCDCARKEKRAERLRQLIERRQAWLTRREGPAPSPRRDALGRGRLAV